MVSVSVIVPVYNVEKHLRKCLDSLVGQTLKNFEIIIVNDGSPDNSQLIIDEYVQRYDNVKSYKKVNGGLSDARNFGIEKALGKYIAFVDSDDYVENDMYQVMYNKAIEGDFDMVVCDFNEIYDDHVFKGNSRIQHDLLSKIEVKKKMYDFYPSAWNKLYKKKLLEKIQFKKGVWFEDVEFLYRLFPYINNVGTVKVPFYQYVQREGSISKCNDKRIYHYIDNWNDIIAYYKDKNIYVEYYDELEFCYVRYLYATFIKAASRFDKTEFTKAVELAIESVKANFPKYRKNKYIKLNFKGLYLLFFNQFLAKIYYMKVNRNIK